jgi:alkylation response protein AidB-like acyl-CoA dehydrogenase
VGSTIGSWARVLRQMWQFEHERMLACYLAVGAMQTARDRTIDYLPTRTARFLRDARLLSIGGGADEVRLHTISRLCGFITGEGSLC